MRLALLSAMHPRQVRLLACGGGHSLFVCGEAEVFGCGENAQGQLGLGHTARSFAPVRSTLLCAAASEAGAAASLACGLAVSFVVSRRGGVVAVGCNADGQLGDGRDSRDGAFSQVRSYRCLLVLMCDLCCSS